MTLKPTDKKVPRADAARQSGRRQDLSTKVSRSVIAGVIAIILLPILSSWATFYIFHPPNGVRLLLTPVIWGTSICLPMFYLQWRKPYRGRILFLRRFHFEHPPAFPLSRVITKLVGKGFEVFTLADSVVDDDAETKLPVIVGILLALVILFYIIAGAGITSLICRDVFDIDFMELDFYGLSNFWQLLSGVLAFVVVLGAMVFGTQLLLRRRPIRSFLTLAFRWISRRVTRLMPRLIVDATQWSLGDVDVLLKKRQRSRLKRGITVIRSSDENWSYLVHRLIQTSSVICIDISNPSRHLITEISTLQKQNRGFHIIWTRTAGGLRPLK